MIPKTIHYCWFGGNPLPEDAKKCIDSWKKHCPDYEIIEWNEDNFDVSSFPYVKEAYESKKYAFITDYVRLYALTTFGGIYMDTDVEVLKSLDEFLDNEAFSGFESSRFIPTGIMASKKDFPLFVELLHYYDNKHFLKTDGTEDTLTNTFIITEICKKHGLVLNNQYQVIDGFVLYPNDYFCPLENETGILRKTKNTATIHWFSKSWLDPSLVKKQKFYRVLHRVFGTEFINKIAKGLKIR